MSICFRLIFPSCPHHRGGTIRTLAPPSKHRPNCSNSRVDRTLHSRLCREGRARLPHCPCCFPPRAAIPLHPQVWRRTGAIAYRQQQPPLTLHHQRAKHRVPVTCVLRGTLEGGGYGACGCPSFPIMERRISYPGSSFASQSGKGNGESPRLGDYLPAFPQDLCRLQNS